MLTIADIRNVADAFVLHEVRPNLRTWEMEESIPLRDLFLKAGRAGLLGITKPEKYGGLGLSYKHNIQFIEAVASTGNSALSMAFGVQTELCTPALSKYGSRVACEEILAPSISGELIGCLGVSEEGAGSDVASIQTKAERSADDYVINGSKMWVTNGDVADWACVLANTEHGASPYKNKSLFIVPLNYEGVSRSAPFSKHGVRESGTVQLFFDNVKIPKSYLIGEEGLGFIYQMEQFDIERLYSAIKLSAQLDRVLDITVEYTVNRKIFNSTLFNQQWVAYNLAKLKTEVTAFKALCETVITKMDNDEDIRELTAMLKLKGGELARIVPDQCLQFFGGQGYMWDAEISKLVRDLRLVAIGGGAMEVMMMIISKHMHAAYVDSAS